MTRHKYARSIDFLLEKAGPVIQYRLRKEILKDLSENEEDKLLGQIYSLPLFQLLTTYAKPNGYIGNGMHSWDNWRGTVLHETPLQDGECAARLLSYYRIPKAHPLVQGSCLHCGMKERCARSSPISRPEISRYENRFEGLNNGNSLMALVYTMQAMLGYGDDYHDLKDFQQVALKGFQRVNRSSSLADIAKFDASAKRKYNYPYIEADQYFPNCYTLQMLAYTQSWRTDENVKMLAHFFNHINTIMKPDNNIHVKINGKYIVPYFALGAPGQGLPPGPD